MAKINTTALIVLQGNLANIGSWQYLEKSIIPKIEGTCLIASQNEGNHMQIPKPEQLNTLTLTITQAIPPARLPLKFVHETKMFDVRISKERLADINALYDGFALIFNKLTEKAWLLIGFLGEDKRDIAIIAIPELNLYMYCLITKDMQKTIENNKHLLN